MFLIVSVVSGTSILILSWCLKHRVSLEQCYCELLSLIAKQTPPGFSGGGGGYSHWFTFTPGWSHYPISGRQPNLFCPSIQRSSSTEMAATVSYEARAAIGCLFGGRGDSSPYLEQSPSTFNQAPWIYTSYFTDADLKSLGAYSRIQQRRPPLSPLPPGPVPPPVP